MSGLALMSGWYPRPKPLTWALWRAYGRTENLRMTKWSFAVVTNPAGSEQPFYLQLLLE